MTVSTHYTQGAQPATGARAITCILTRECPPGWDALLVGCDGGFFHSPSAPEVSGPRGNPVFARLQVGKEIVGIGVGVNRGCRLAATPRHYFFPTVPALVSGVRPNAALDALVRALRAADAAELTMESFDAPWSADATVQADASRVREEYVVPLADTAVMLDALSSGHRRQMRRGDRAGWRMECPEGDEARALLVAVQEVASRRAAARGSGFAVRVPRLVGLESAGVRSWGATMFAAWNGTVPLAAALVGWANRRAFYVMGGSTPEGYECGASVWLHWRIATRLSESGFQTYNLGGAAASAASPEHPGHGLYRFKRGFGARVIPCRSMSWILSARHERVHQLGRWLGKTTSSITRET